MQDIVNLFLNTGVSLGVIVYFIYRDWKFMDTLKETLQTLVDTISALQDSVKFFHGEEVRKND